MPMSLALSNSLSNFIVSNTPIAALAGANRYLALHTADPTSSCAVGELSGDNYSRVLIPFSIIALSKGRGLVNSEVIVYPVATGTKGAQILFGSVWDSLNGGTPLSYGPLTTPANWVEGASLALAVNAFVQLIRNTI